VLDDALGQFASSPALRSAEVEDTADCVGLLQEVGHQLARPCARHERGSAHILAENGEPPSAVILPDMAGEIGCVGRRSDRLRRTTGEVLGELYVAYGDIAEASDDDASGDRAALRGEFRHHGPDLAVQRL